MDTINTALSTMEPLALGLNILTIYLIKRMGSKEIDMWLAVTMAICDLIIASFKIMELPILSLIREVSSILGYNIAIPLSGIILVLVAGSITNVSYLSIIRWLAICRGYPLEKLKYTKPIYLLHITFLYIIIYLGYTNDGFILMPNGSYYYPDFSMTNTWGFMINLTLTLNVSFCLLSFNISYILITSQYLEQLNKVDLNLCQNLINRLTKEKFKIVFNITLMLILYNLTVAPLLTISLTELITARARTLTADLITSSGITGIILINPTMLILMHSDTWREFINLFTTPTPNRTPYYPMLDDRDTKDPVDSRHRHQ